MQSIYFELELFFELDSILQYFDKYYPYHPVPNKNLKIVKIIYASILAFFNY